MPQPQLAAPPSKPIVWSDLAPGAGPRKDVLKAGDIVRKVITVLTPASTIDRDAMELEMHVSGQAMRDSYGDLVPVTGWDFERWIKNPVVMWAHEYWIPPIGVGLWIKEDGDNLRSRMRFWNGDGEWGDYAREIFSMYASDPPFMRMFSVGFQPTKWEAIYDTTENGGKVFVGYDYIEKELWEYSCVPIGAYPDALARAVQDGGHPKLDAMLKTFAGLKATPDPAERPDELADLRTALTKTCVQSMARNLRAALRKSHAA